MSKTNHLTSHNGESRNSRANKMSGLIGHINKNIRKLTGENAEWNSSEKKNIKDFSNKKRRMFLKNPFNWNKI